VIGMRSHPLWSYVDLSDEDLRDILSSPDHDLFELMACQLLAHARSDDEVFSFIDSDILRDHYPEIREKLSNPEYWDEWYGGEDYDA